MAFLPHPTNEPAGLPPVASRDAMVLVLGSYPGAQSLATRRYYAHGQNRFWATMGRIVGVQESAPYEERLCALRAHRVALWDVLATCEREGSMDADIVPDTEVVNDFAGFFARHRAIRGVCFNGRTAAALFARHVLPEDFWGESDLLFQVLPSTSPAHAAMRARELADHWDRAINRVLPVSSSASVPRAG
jgi:hypoxanthine-DNA glycosylase